MARNPIVPFATILALALPLVCVLAPPVARAEIPGVTWGPPEIVDAPVPELPASSGVSVVSWQSQWRVVYEKEGDIYWATRTGSGWLPPVAVTNDAALQRNPHLAATDLSLHVVWEDLSGDHAEVWARQWNGSEWTQAECLTCDAVSSRAPVIAGDYEIAYAAWEDSTGTGFRVRGRLYANGSWGSVQEVSTNPADARDPSVAIVPDMGLILVAWADSRHGAPEIYMRGQFAGWGWLGEQRLTDLPEACRRPSLGAEVCCGDAINEAPFVAFEATGGSGVPETWLADCSGSYVRRISADDGIPSVNPNAGSFSFVAYECGWGGPDPRDFVAWTDVLGPLSRTRRLIETRYCGDPMGEEAISTTGYSHTVVGAVEGRPDAGLMQVWIEDAGGVATLLARRGSLLGCAWTVLEGPPALIVAPGGLPSNTIRMFDECSTDPFVGRRIYLTFDPALDQVLRWDPQQVHPQIMVLTDDAGEAVFRIRAGGCSQAGVAWAACDAPDMPETGWGGVKSPDVNGDCVVRHDDLAYVTSMLGTDDFCADLNGSGTVDFEDVMIVTMTMGDHCSDIIGVEEEGNLRAAPSFTVYPNPCEEAAILRLTMAADSRILVQIADATGRLVRVLVSEQAPSGTVTLPWDLRDDAGRPVPSGLYFGVARIGDGTLRRPILVMR